MPACDVVEPKAQCTPANFLWQTLFARVHEKILSIVFLLQMSLSLLSFVVETLSCELALANTV